MRLAAQAKLGFYPIKPAAIEALLTHLTPADPARPPTVLDPCCGAGAALAQIGAGLGSPPSNLFGIELEEGRSEQARAALPGATIVGPCSYFDSQVRPPRAFGLVFLNPPFDNELGGGGRQEESFFHRAVCHMPAGGIFAMILPDTTFRYARDHRGGIREAIDCYLEDAEVFELPKEARPFNEVAIIGVRRDSAIGPKDEGFAGKWSRRWSPYDAQSHYQPSKLPVLGTTDHRWRVPPGRRPEQVLKLAPTDQEIIRAINDSPLDRLLQPPKPRPKPRPPLALGHGHRCLLLASGVLNGLVHPEGERPHVVRGTCRKEDVIKEDTEDEDGSTKTVKVERIVMTVRAVGSDGEIRTFEQ